MYNLEEKLTNLEQVLLRTQMIIDEDKREGQRDQILKMMYLDDIDSEFVKNTLKISDNELKSIVDELVELGFLQFISDDEVEISKKGSIYAKNQGWGF